MLTRKHRQAIYAVVNRLLPPAWKPAPPINWGERKYTWDVDHYGEVLEGKQARLKRKINERLSKEDYRCRIPDAKHPVIKVKMGRKV